MTEEVQERRKPGRPRIADPVLAKARQAVLIRVRNRALFILAGRHPEEFVEIKNALLERAGHPPIDPSFQTREPELTVESPLDLGKPVWQRVAAPESVE